MLVWHKFGLFSLAQPPSRALLPVSTTLHGALLLSVFSCVKISKGRGACLIVYIKAKSFTTDQELRTAGILSICDLIAYTVESERPEAIDSNSPTDLGLILLSEI